jgi:hypothetical protein
MMQAIPHSPPRMKDDALALSLDQLRLAIATDVPGRQREWAEAVEDALASVEKALRQHRAAAKAPDGLLAEVDETRPTLARQADGLRSDHDEFLAQVLALRKELQRAAEAFRPANIPSIMTLAGGVPDFGAIRQQAEQLVAALQENKEAETKLVLESVNTDIGVGD